MDITHKTHSLLLTSVDLKQQYTAEHLERPVYQLLLFELFFFTVPIIMEGSAYNLFIFVLHWEEYWSSKKHGSHKIIVHWECFYVCQSSEVKGHGENTLVLELVYEARIS